MEPPPNPDRREDCHDEESGPEEYEYEFESGMAAGAREAIQEWEAEDEAAEQVLRRLPAVAVPPAEPDVDEDEPLAELLGVARPVADLSQYGRFLRRGVGPGKKYINVVDTDLTTVIGQIQPMPMGSFRPGYQAAGACFHAAHKGGQRCARLRAWKMGSELPQAVDHVLCHWIHQANSYVSAERHMNAVRH